MVFHDATWQMGILEGGYIRGNAWDDHKTRLVGDSSSEIETFLEPRVSFI